jgi:hypothetical protein
VNLSSFVCPFCNWRVYRENAGEVKCECGATVFTEPPKFEGDDFQVTQAYPPPPTADYPALIRNPQFRRVSPADTA